MELEPSFSLPLHSYLNTHTPAILIITFMELMIKVPESRLREKLKLATIWPEAFRGHTHALFSCPPIFSLLSPTITQQRFARMSQQAQCGAPGRGNPLSLTRA